MGGGNLTVANVQQIVQPFFQPAFNRAIKKWGLVGRNKETGKGVDKRFNTDGDGELTTTEGMPVNGKKLDCFGKGVGKRPLEEEEAQVSAPPSKRSNIFELLGS